MEHPLLVLLGQVLGSTFVVSAIGALAGASAGALGAQRVIERAKRKDDLQKEIRNTNAAIMVAFTIANTALGLKRQLVKPMQEKFQADLESFKKYLREREVGMRQGNAPYELVADFKNFLPPAVPIDTLKKLVYEGISSAGKPLGIVALVDTAAVGLTHSLSERRRVIADLQANAFEGEDLVRRYLGHESARGQTHREYADLVDVISGYTDDLIYFSAALADALTKHGNAVRSVYVEKYGTDVSNISSLDFSKVKATGLFPPDSNYASWSQWVVERQENEAK
jgi:hypothetical protein